MPRVNRTEICAVDEIQVFHLINRCVRRTFLCGEDVEGRTRGGGAYHGRRGVPGEEGRTRGGWAYQGRRGVPGVRSLCCVALAVLLNFRDGTHETHLSGR